MKNKSKVVEIIADAGETGGPAHLLLLIKGLKKLGFEIIVISPTGPLVKKLKRLGIAHRAVRMKSPYDRSSYHKIRQMIKEINPALVHCHGVRGGWLGRLATRKIKGLPVIYTEHSYNTDYHIDNPLWERVQVRGLRLMNRHTTTTIAVSQSVKKCLVKRKIAKPEQIKVIYNGVDPRFGKVIPYQKPKGVPIAFGSVGSFHPRKGFEYLIRALGLLKNQKSLPWACQIIGSGPTKKKLEKLIKKFKLENQVRIRENLPNVLDAYRHFGFYIQSSLDEAFGMAVAEAMLVGLPAIVSRAGALPELVKDQETGLVVSPKDPENLCQAIKTLVLDEKLRKQMGEAAKKRALRLFTADRMVKETAKLYKRIVKTNEG